MKIKQLPRYPRFINKIYAKLFAYFWLSCPICKTYFGGHEWGSESIPIENGINQAICWKHTGLLQGGK